MTTPQWSPAHPAGLPETLGERRVMLDRLLLERFGRHPIPSVDVMRPGVVPLMGPLDTDPGTG